MSEAIAAFELLLVLEYCDRGSLRMLLDLGPPPYLTILQFAMDICKGMLHLHATSILHLDLKSANVLIKTVGQDGACLCKVADFGELISCMALLSWALTLLTNNETKAWRSLSILTLPRLALQQGH